MSLNDIVGHTIASKGKKLYGFLFNGLWAVVLMSFTYQMVNAGHGAWGLALATLLAYVLHTIWQFVFLASNYSILAKR